MGAFSSWSKGITFIARLLVLLFAVASASRVTRSRLRGVDVPSAPASEAGIIHAAVHGADTTPFDVVAAAKRCCSGSPSQAGAPSPEPEPLKPEEDAKRPDCLCSEEKEHPESELKPNAVKPLKVSQDVKGVENLPQERPPGSLVNSERVEERLANLKNTTAKLLSNYAALQVEVKKEWGDWTTMAGSLGPKVAKLKEESNGLRSLVDSVKQNSIPNVEDVCGKLSSCSECAASTMCGWCTSNLKCVPGTADGALEPGGCAGSSGAGVNAAAGAVGAYSFETCPGMACEVYKSCTTCTRGASCGWCAGVGCMEGSEWGPQAVMSAVAMGGPQVPTCGFTGPQDPQAAPTAWVHMNAEDRQCHL